MAAPIISPRFAEYEDLPNHVRGTRYTRPVFENYRGGPYQPGPIIVYGDGRALAGFDVTDSSGWKWALFAAVVVGVVWYVGAKHGNK